MKRKIWRTKALAAFAFGALASAFHVGATAGESLVIADFEGDAKPFKNGAVVNEHATTGKSSYKLPVKRFINASRSTGLPRDWSKYDLFKMDVYNPSAKPVKVYIQLRDATPDRGYWSWHNRYTAAASGKSTVQFALADTWRGEVLRHDIPGSLELNRIGALNINAQDEIFIDNVRLEKSAVAKVEVPGLKAFDVGKAGSPAFNGFTALTEKDGYSKAKGFGWLRSDFARMDDRIHPDNLFRDNLSCRNAELAVDVPNGKYRVHLQLEDPSYWELMQFYHRRTVVAEGKTVIDERMGAKEFKDRYFQNQDAEDLPGEDPFQKYVQTRHPWHTFDVDVTDGQLNVAFRSGDTYGNTLSAVIVYPAEHGVKGREFLAYVAGMRRFEWAQSWKTVADPVKPPKLSGRMARDAARDGFALYAVSPYEDTSYNYAPTDADALSGLEATVARGEFEPMTFGLRPAKKLGKVEVTATDLRGPAGAVIAAGDIDIRVGRYRFTRHSGHQSGLYTVAERELRRFNETDADRLVCNDGLARRFWITVNPGAEQTAGVYKGLLAVKAENGGSRSVPVSVRVIPVSLPEADILFGLYGVEVLPMPYFPEMKAERPKQIEAVYRDLRDHGVNYLKDSPVHVVWQGGKAVITNTAEAERIFAQRKRLGFKDGPVNVGRRVGLQQIAYGDRIEGLPKNEYIGKWYLEITRQFEARGWPHPCFCYGDEPNVPETLKALATAHRNLHAVSPDIWTNIAYHTSSPESYDMLKTLDVQHLKRFCKVEDFHLAKKYGKVVIASNVGRNRFAYGLWSWRAVKERKIDGSITFSYTGSHVDIYYGLDAREDDFSMAPPRRDGTLAQTANWERIREGIDDYRYCVLLSKMSSAEAKKLLDEAYELGGVLDRGEKVEMGSSGKMAPVIERVIEWRTKVHDLLPK
jgi:hypothetical protein